MNSMKQTVLKWWREWIAPLLVVLGVMLPFRSSVADWYQVPTGSMKPTILEGDRVFVNKLAYDLKIPFTTKQIFQWSDPARGDIVVLYSPEDRIRLVKRVIGLPGDIIELSDNKLIINGQPLEYERISEQSYSEKGIHTFSLRSNEILEGKPHPILTLSEISVLRSFNRTQVPLNSYFVMGDNRDRSKDSRYFGFVQRDQIVGQATEVVFSLDPDQWYLPRGGRFFEVLR
jgi:signal peptidase I